MKIAFLAHRELASALAVNLVARQLQDHELRIFVSGEHRAFAGAEAVHKLERVELDMERALDRLPPGQQPAPLRSLDTLAREFGAPLQPLARPNHSEGLALLEACAPDLLLSIRYRRILHDEAIAIPKLGVINWHSGLLPEYRGVMATFWAMGHGDAQIGSTLHYITDSSIDTGPAIGRYTLDCRYECTYLDNVLRLYLDAAGQVAAAVEQVLRGDAPPACEHTGEARYFSAPTERDVAAFEAAGCTLFDGQELSRLVGTF